MTGAIIKGEEHFYNVIYEGNGKGQRVGKFVPYTDNGTIAKSLIFDDGDNAYLQRTNDAGDRDTFTVSVWVKRGNIGSVQHIFDTYDGSSTNDGYIRFNSNNTISTRIGTPSNHLYTTNRTFEDTTKWYHIVLSVNTNESTAGDRVKLYVDGDLITSYSTQTNPGSGDDTQFNYSSANFRIGSTTSGNYDFDGYIAEFNLVDGSALTPSTFGLTDTSTGRWIPKTLTGITYGTNGHRLEFANSAGQTIGDDTSGNTNDFSVTNLVIGDLTTDSPTQNFTTLDSGISGSMTLSEGNLRYTTSSSSNWESIYSDKSINTGKWYFEVTCKVTTAYDAQPGVILESVLATNKNQLMGYSDGSVGYNMDNAQNTLYYGNSGNAYLVHSATDASTAGVIIGVAYDADTGAMWFAKNNTWVNNGDGAGNPSTGANPTFIEPMFAKQNVRFGFSTYNASASYEINFGGKAFNYTPPTDFNKVQQDNLTDDGKGISDLTWIKDRDNSSYYHTLVDSSRGANKELYSNENAVEAPTNDSVTKFLKGGVEVEDAVNVNNSGDSFVSWNWVANGGTTAANTDGSGASIASTTQANQTAGFSIVQWTGSGSNGTVAHGLSQAPDWILIKNLTASGQSWHVYLNLPGMGNNRALFLDTNASYSSSSNFFNDTNPTNKVFTVGTSGGVNQSTKSMLAYCWHEVEGYSKFGAYLGNQNADGPFIHCGFKPSWVMIKKYSGTGEWFILDRGRNPINTGTKEYLDADTADSGGSLDAGAIDFLSNGFKIRQVSSQINYGTHAFLAFAEHPFNGDGANAFATAL